jgi:HEAT repeat protein
LIRSGSSEAEKVRIAAANALAHIGGATDCEALFPLLDDTAEFVRVSAIRALAKIGDENAALRIERFLNTRKKHASQDEIQKDTSIKEGAKAIEMIKKRLAEAKTPTTSK